MEEYVFDCIFVRKIFRIFNISKKRKILTRKLIITGGAGFIGCHTANYFAKKGYEVVIIDNLSRKGSLHNLNWLKKQHPLTLYKTNIQDNKAIKDIFKKENNLRAIIHLAAQVAVTTSVSNPINDFNINALGTLNILEAVRHFSPNSPFIYSSTNKVYGLLNKVKIIEGLKRYEIENKMGISETEPLDFHSPYGCSKGSADQYVLDYARIFNLKTVSFRQSCIYGERQFGIEDQGWLAWFIIATILGRKISIYGDGKQVRDVLYIQDLVKLYENFIEKGSNLNGKAYNVGGGLKFSLSLIEFIDILKEHGLEISYTFGDWRPGDQKVFVSDNTKVIKELGWKPKTTPVQGIQKIISWVKNNKELINNFMTN